MNIKNWEDFFNAMGASESYKKGILKDVDGWVKSCVERSEKKGPKYTRSN
jgi:hypothetical protein